MTLGVGHMARHIIYYNREGDGFPQVRVVVSFMGLCVLVALLRTKMLQLRTNQFVIWFVQVYVND
jgi:hypothetical protein